MKTTVLFLILSFVLLVCANSNICAQGIGINSSGNPPDPSALLDLSSTTKGLLLVRMNTLQRNAITSPVAGLLIYNTDCNNLNLYNGSAWVDMAGNAVAGPPSSPTAATHTSTSTQITWNWNTALGATGYKYSTVNNYSLAI